MADESEQLNETGMAELGQRAADGPVVMLNLLAFHPDGGAERYGEYAAAVAPLLERAGGRLLFAGEAAPAVIGEVSWDVAALVEYPTRQAFLDMVSSTEYLEIAHLRTESLVRSELHPIEPGDLPGQFS
jgi:uncharacterized protein (DUF1330 family)